MILWLYMYDSSKCKAGAKQQSPVLQPSLCVLEAVSTETVVQFLDILCLSFWCGGSWCSLFLLETSVSREPEGMSEPALKDRYTTIFWNSVPYLHAFRLWIPEADNWFCTSGLIKGQIPHLRTGHLGRYERDWILYLHPLQMPILLCRIGFIWHSKRCVSHVSFSVQMPIYLFYLKKMLGFAWVRALSEAQGKSTGQWPPRSMWSMRNCHYSEWRMPMSFLSSTVIQRSSPTSCFC